MDVRGVGLRIRFELQPCPCTHAPVLKSEKMDRIDGKVQVKFVILLGDERTTNEERESSETSSVLW